jgi:hypothetical protein
MPDETPMQTMLRRRDALQAALFKRILGKPGAEQIDVIGNETVVGVEAASKQGTAPDPEDTLEAQVNRAAAIARETYDQERANAERDAAEQEAVKPTFTQGVVGKAEGVVPAQPNPNRWLRDIIDSGRTYPT